MSPGPGPRFPGPGLRDPWDPVPDADPWTKVRMATFYLKKQSNPPMKSSKPDSKSFSNMFVKIRKNNDRIKVLLVLLFLFQIKTIFFEK